MAELVGISTIVQNVLYQTKFKKHICVHSPKIREKFEILNRTLKKVAKGVFDYIFGDLSAVKPINLELLANGATVQYKQVKAVAESARAITKELACDKLNSVIRENAIAGYVFWPFWKTIDDLQLYWLQRCLLVNNKFPSKTIWRNKYFYIS